MPSRSNLIPRALTALFGIPFVLALDHLGGWYFAAAVGLVAAVASSEVAGLLRRTHRPPVPSRAASIAGVAGAIAAGISPELPGSPQAWWTGILIAILVFSSLTELRRPQPGTWYLSVIPVLYVGVTLGHLIALREARDGAWWVLVILVITWAYDSGAYLVGSTVGKHGFMRHVSASKTVEGLGGGLVLAAIAGLLAHPTIGLAWWQGASLGLFGGIATQAGDLLESMIKRQAGVKDAGSILPGHGGMLDRVDGLLLSGVLAYYAAMALGYAS
ncbi:MAG: phosphatidate cytidylyltransferase [Chloroflexota bacterium]